MDAMHKIILIFIGLLVFIFIAVILMYNTLIKLQNRVFYALSSIDALLKKRYDLIPNLINTVKEYMGYEKDLLSSLTELRTQAIIGTLPSHRQKEVDKEITKIVRYLVAVAENYPALKASSNFLQLQAALNEVEEQISAARRALSANITEYNDALKTYPTKIVASLFGFKELKWYEVTEKERTEIDVKVLFRD